MTNSGRPLLLLAILTGMLPASARAQGTEGEYTFYSNGVKKGYSRYHADARGRLILEGDSGLGSTSRGSIELSAGEKQSIEFEVTGAGAARVEYGEVGGALVRKGVEGAADMPVATGARFYYPLHPVLLRDLLRQAHHQAGHFDKLPAVDLLTGKPRDVRANLVRTRTFRIAGKEVRVRQWRLESPPTGEAVVYTNDDDLPLYWWIPARQFEMVRTGCDELRPGYQYQKTVSHPKYAMKVLRDIWIPMRDGVRLMADIYLPDSPGRFPVLLQRTCYDRSEFGLADGEFYAQRGYVYVTQHVRGRGGSEGAFSPFTQEAADGHDTVEWCAAQPWSTGKVGMLGASFNGYCEWMAAKTHPRGLTTMISTVPMPGPPDGAPWSGGSFFVGAMLGWYGLLRDPARTQPFNDDLTAAMNTLPISAADTVQFGGSIPSFQSALQHDRFDGTIRQGSYRSEISTIDLPVLHVSGWLDSVGIGTRLNYTQMVANGRRGQKLVWGPWDHFTNRESRVGEWDFGIDGYIDLKMLCLRWFDRYLKGRRNGIDTEPPVSSYLLGENRWRSSAEWPPRNVRPERWYLHAPSAHGVGGLSRSAPAGEQPQTYRYDPAKAVYSANNQVSFFFAMLGGLDVDPLCRAKSGDRVIYESRPLARPLRLSGPIRGTLSASSTAVDTDWVLALVDVSPSGKALTLGCGMVRARFRASLDHPTLLKANQEARYSIDMWQAGVLIPRGHRLRVVVLSTLFPDTDRNLNTGESIANGTRLAAATQTIYHDSIHLSYVTLPVVVEPGRM